jgi:hypothetical protein
MPVREREIDDLPFPICPCSTERSGGDLMFLLQSFSFSSSSSSSKSSTHFNSEIPRTKAKNAGCHE